MSAISVTDHKRNREENWRNETESASNAAKTRKLIHHHDKYESVAKLKDLPRGIIESASNYSIQDRFFGDEIMDAHVFGIIGEFSPKGLLRLSSACSRSANSLNLILKEMAHKNLEELLFGAVKQNDSNLVRALNQSSRSGEIPTKALETAFQIAIEKGLTDTIIELTSCSRFKELSIGCLESAFHLAIEQKNFENFIHIINCSRFHEISTKILETAFLGAVKWRNTKPLEVLMRSPRFQEISNEILESGFENTALLGLLENSRILQNCHRFNQISKESLETAFLIAVGSGRDDFIENMMAHSQFSKISEDTHQYAMECAKQQNNQKILDILSKNKSQEG